MYKRQDPYIELQTPDWQGYAKGYTVTLEADQLYLITAAVTEPEADYTDRCVSILTGGELTGSEEDDLIMYKTGYADGPSCTTTLLFRPEAAGDYRILAHGYATTDLGEVDVYKRQSSFPWSLPRESPASSSPTWA